MKAIAFRKLILNDLNPDKHTITAEEIANWQSIIPEVAEQMIYRLYFISRTQFGHGMLRAKVQHLQMDCATLLNAVTKLNSTIAGTAELKQQIADCLEQVLDRIEQEYPEYLNQDATIPDLRFKKALHSFLKNTELINTEFERHGIETSLRKMIINPMKAIDGLKRCSYGRLNYLSRLQEEILLLMAEKQNDTQSELLKLLFAMNFNNDEFINYYQNHILNEVNAIDSDMQKEFCLKRYCKLFKKPPFKMKVKFDYRKNSAAHTLFNFVDLEYQKLESERNRQMAQARVERIQEVEVKNKAENYKLLSLMSVDVIAYMFRLMAEAEVLEAGVKTEFTSFLAGIIRTPGSGMNGIGAPSFYNKYRQPVQSTSIVVKGVLNKMIKIIDKQF
ncbi:MAG: hypothetical protein EOO85_15210 [Pedobacter sp.]|nr:MAG: hypothetical protein EOO85_15210 [Pedobacter sp.]